MADIIGQKWKVYNYAEVSSLIPEAGEVVCITHTEKPGMVFALVGTGIKNIQILYEESKKIEEAPSDNIIRGRKNKAWEQIPITQPADLTYQQAVAGQAQRNGVATTFARSDHYHPLPVGGGGGAVPGIIPQPVEVNYQFSDFNKMIAPGRYTATESYTGDLANGPPVNLNTIPGQIGGYQEWYLDISKVGNNRYRQDIYLSDGQHWFRVGKYDGTYYSWNNWQLNTDFLPKIVRVMSARDLSNTGYSNFYQPIIFHFDKPAPGNCYIQLWRYSSRRSHSLRRSRLSYKPIGLHLMQPSSAIGTWGFQLSNFKIPEGKTKFTLPLSPQQLYKPPKVRGKGYYKHANPYLQMGGGNFNGNNLLSNRCLYRFSVSQWVPGQRLIEGIPCADILEIMGWAEGHNSKVTMIARLKTLGM